MKIFAQIIGWAAILVGVVAIIIQSVPFAYGAIALGVIGLFMKDSRGMGGTGIAFGVLAWLMANIFS